MQAKWIKWAAIPLALALGIGADKLFESKPADQGVEQQAPISREGHSSASRSPRGKPVNGEMTIANAYITSRGLWLLGTMEDYTDAKNETLVVDPKKIKDLAVTDPNELMGARVSYTGFESFYRGKKQVQATKLSVKEAK